MSQEVLKLLLAPRFFDPDSWSKADLSVKSASFWKWKGGGKVDISSSPASSPILQVHFAKSPSSHCQVAMSTLPSCSPRPHCQLAKSTSSYASHRWATNCSQLVFMSCPICLICIPSLVGFLLGFQSPSPK